MATSTPTPSKSSAKKPAKPAAKPNTVALNEKPAMPVQDKPTKPKKPVEAKKAVVAKKPIETKKPAEAEKPAKVKKPKLVRDSFTIPKEEYLVIDSLKQRSAKLGQPMKKSELLRAGIKVLNSLDDVQFKQALTAVPAIKTGRPKAAK
jgi:hypothetical protein